MESWLLQLAGIAARNRIPSGANAGRARAASDRSIMGSFDLPSRGRRAGHGDKRFPRRSRATIPAGLSALERLSFPPDPDRRPPMKKRSAKQDQPSAAPRTA